jgi:hypothetical protein
MSGQCRDIGTCGDKVNTVPAETARIEGAETGHRDTPPKGCPSVPASPTPTGFSEEEWVLFEERAAIREYDGGVPRAAAERLAWMDVLRARQTSSTMFPRLGNRQAAT